MNLINLTPHTLNFTDGTEMAPSGYIATIEWKTETEEKNGLTLLKKFPEINTKSLVELAGKIGIDGFGIVSFPVVSACRGTMLEGRVGSVEMKSRTEKIAVVNTFCV